MGCLSIVDTCVPVQVHVKSDRLLEIHPETPVSGWKDLPDLPVSCIDSTKLLHSQVNQTGRVARKTLEVDCKRSKCRQERHFAGRFAHRLASRGLESLDRLCSRRASGRDDRNSQPK